MDKTDFASERYQKEVDDFLGPDQPYDDETPLSPEELLKRLKNAQNANRGHPRIGEPREVLKQINVSCQEDISKQFTDLSLRTGKTKRTLLEEAIRHIIRKYAH